jgi:hypothetical protein
VIRKKLLSPGEVNTAVKTYFAPSGVALSTALSILLECNKDISRQVYLVIKFIGGLDSKRSAVPGVVRGSNTGLIGHS